MTGSFGASLGNDKTLEFSTVFFFHFVFGIPTLNGNAILLPSRSFGVGFTVKFALVDNGLTFLDSKFFRKLLEDLASRTLDLEINMFNFRLSHLSY